MSKIWKTMSKKKLKVVPPPIDSSTTIFKTEDKNPLVKGYEPESYTCGNCDFVLLENVINYNFEHKVFQCPKCKSYNKSE